MSGETTLVVLLLLPFVGSIAAMLLRTNARNAAASLAGATALAALLMALRCYSDVAAGRVLRFAVPWLPAGGVDFALRMDGYAWMFSIIVTGIGFLVAFYARYYMSPQDPVPRFYSFLLAFMGAMLGVVLSGNLIVLVFFWELTSLASFLLIGYWHHNAAARDGARMALIVTSAGGLCLLAGVLVLGHIVGSYDLDRVLAAREAIVGARAVPAGARADPVGRAHQERAVPVPLLAAAGDDGADAGFGLSALGRDGEAGRFPDGTPVARVVGHRRVDLDRRQRGARHVRASVLTPRSSSATSRACSPIRRSAISA